MPLSAETFWTVLEALPEHVAVVDSEGWIIATNRAWRGFAADNGATNHKSLSPGANYLDACRPAVAQGDVLAAEALEGIEDVLAGRLQRFTLEYPCHSAHVERWFVMTAVCATKDYAVLSHANVTRLKEAEFAARASQEHLRLIQARLAAIATYAPVGLGLCDRDGRWVYKNPMLSGITANFIPSRDSDQSKHWQAFNRNGESVPIPEWPVERALRGEIVAPGLDFITKVGGEERWFCVAAVPILETEVGPSAVVIFEDITSRKSAEQQLKLLMQEVKHRSKNLLSVVLSVASLTAGDKHAAFVQTLGERVRALALTQDLLFGTDAKGVQLTQLIRSQLAHLRDLLGERITLAGPAVQLAPSAAQTLGVVVHELSTNATKYGALSTPLGRIAINWTLEGGRFRLTWQEAEGPSVVAPACAGYGSTVIAAMTRMTLSADVTIDYAPAGLVWTLQCALENIIDPYSEG